MLGRYVPRAMLTGSMTVTLKTPIVATGTACMGICADSPRVVPNNVAEVADEPQCTSNSVAVPGADGLGVMLTRGVCAAAAGRAPVSSGPASSAPQRDAAAAAVLMKRTGPPR